MYVVSMRRTRPTDHLFTIMYMARLQMFQAARPRTKCNTGQTPTFPTSSPTRKQDIAAASEALEAARGVTERAGYEQGWPEEPLWIVVNRFVSQEFLQRREGGQNGRAVTLTFMHANGFTKEVRRPCTGPGVVPEPDHYYSELGRNPQSYGQVLPGLQRYSGRNMVTRCS